MITRVLILQCDFCTRTTRIRGGWATEAGLIEKATAKGWTRTPYPQFPQISPTDRCPKCAKSGGSVRTTEETTP